MAKVHSISSTATSGGYGAIFLAKENLPIITSGMAAISMLIAESSLNGKSDPGTVADAAFLFSQLAELVEDLASGGAL